MFFRYLKNINIIVLLLIFVLFVFSLFMISSATDNSIEDFNRFIKIQTLAFLIGIILLGVMVAIDYNILGNFHWVIYALSIGILLLVYVPGLGVVKNNARSWIDLGPIYLQTSEISKIGFIIFFSKFLADEERKLERLKDLIIPVILLMPFLGLLFLQPDLGSALVFVFIFVGLLFIAGLNMKIILGGILSVGVTIPLLYPLIYKAMKPHQRLRLDAFWNPNDPSLPGNYHVMQSKITIGSGKVFGRGIFEGLYHKYNYLPVRESDFIFAVIGEETGFVGTSIIVLIYFVLLFQMVKMGIEAKDKYGGLIIFGVMFMFAFQIIENIGMTIGLMPVTGITLPFLSYGGSSIVTNMIAIGLTFSVYSRRMRQSEML